MSTITIYGRPGCHLCDEAEARVADLVSDGVTIEVINIEHDDALHKELLELIPVIEVDGERVAKLVEFRHGTFAEVIGKTLSN
jgi:glutaredoxin